MAAKTGKSARIRITAATATASTNNAATLSTSGLVVTIDSSDRRHWDRNSTVGVYEGATNRTTDIASINYVQGKVTLDTAHSTASSWTLDVGYLTSSYVAQGRSWSADVETDLLDVTTFSTSTGDTTWRSITPGLSGGQVTIDRLWAETTGPAFFDRLNSETPTVIELWTDSASQDKLEGFAYVADDAFEVPIEDLAGESVTLRFDGAVYRSTA